PGWRGPKRQMPRLAFGDRSEFHLLGQSVNRRQIITSSAGGQGQLFLQLGVTRRSLPLGGKTRHFEPTFMNLAGNWIGDAEAVFSHREHAKPRFEQAFAKHWHENLLHLRSS